MNTARTVEFRNISPENIVQIISWLVDYFGPPSNTPYYEILSWFDTSCEFLMLDENDALMLVLACKEYNPKIK